MAANPGINVPYFVHAGESTHSLRRGRIQDLKHNKGWERTALQERAQIKDVDTLSKYEHLARHNGWKAGKRKRVE